jgi:uncharacterized membrane protein YbhN (UPF0104 family)
MLLAYTLGQAGSVIPLPGTTEGGLVGVFVLYGAPLALTAAAVLLYRAAQSVIPLVLGALGLVGLSIPARGSFAHRVAARLQDSLQVKEKGGGVRRPC